MATKPTCLQRDRCRRRLVLAARFLDAFIRKGVIKSFGVLVPAMIVQLATNYTTLGLVMSLNAAFTQLMCLVVNPLVKKMETRPIAMVGGLASGVCIVCTAFCRSLAASSFFFVSAGLFAATSNLGTAITLQQHYLEKFGAMNSLALIGIAAGSTLLPLVTAELYQQYGLHGTLLLLGGLLLNELPIGAVLRPPRVAHQPRAERGDGSLERTYELTDGSAVTNCHSHPSDGFVKPEHNRQEAISKCSEVKETDSVTVSLNNGGFAKEEAVKSSLSDFLSVFTDQFDLRVFREEKHFTFILLPFLILSSITNYGWVLFVTSYAISVGVESFAAAYLAAAGAMGGIVSCMIQGLVFQKRPLWSPHLMAAFSLCGSVTLFIQTLHSTLPYLLICSFFIGGSLYGTSVVVDAVVAVIVSPENFQGAIAFTFALEGIGTLIAGPFSGFLFDVTQSFETVFMVLGGIMLVTLSLACGLILARRLDTGRQRASPVNGAVVISDPDDSPCSVSAAKL
ncbi:monocarboxylate transporter 1-like [Diadema antillarum]|uniref:monocarboxylate transporter 1-like n=1 Tax=Diadema antillarum TaxID=105358 RepID=UPI003A8609BE